MVLRRPGLGLACSAGNTQRRRICYSRGNPRQGRTGPHHRLRRRDHHSRLCLSSGLSRVLCEWTELVGSCLGHWILDHPDSCRAQFVGVSLANNFSTHPVLPRDFGDSANEALVGASIDTDHAFNVFTPH